jgi:hypothetical protein
VDAYAHIGQAISAGFATAGQHPLRGRGELHALGGQARADRERDAAQTGFGGSLSSARGGWSPLRRMMKNPAQAGFFSFPA